MFNEFIYFWVYGGMSRSVEQTNRLNREACDDWIKTFVTHEFARSLSDSLADSLD